MRKINQAALSLLVCIASALAAQTRSLANEAECKKPRFKTGISVFMASGEVGNIGFSFNKNPLTVQMVSSGDCYKILNKLRGKRVYFFVNHRTTANVGYTSFLAVQVVKKYKTLRFEADRVTAVRKGSWIRSVSGVQKILAEVYPMSSFDGMSPERFGQVHKTKPFDEKPLLDSLKGIFWHAKPINADVGSLDRLPYWSTHIPDDTSTKVENYLIRFEALAFEEKPKQNRNGIPFDTRFHKDLEEMDLSIRSPADGGIQVEFSIK